MSLFFGLEVILGIYGHFEILSLRGLYKNLRKTQNDPNPFILPLIQKTKNTLFSSTLKVGEHKMSLFFGLEDI